MEIDNYIHDCHCHLGVGAEVRDVPLLVEAFRAETRVHGPLSLHIMSTNHLDLAVLEQLVQCDTRTVVPYFGVHPWYSHLFSTTEHIDKAQHYKRCLSPAPDPQLLEVLPAPIFLGDHMIRVRKLAEACIAARIRYGIGEIGLDKLFRVPSNGFYGNNPASDSAGASAVRLTGCKVAMAHQQQVLTAQLQLALELGAPVSLHCVKAHGALFDTVTQGFEGISTVVLHSYSGSVDQARAWVARFRARNRQLRFSFSRVINGSKPAALEQLAAVLDDSHILPESDMPVDEFFLRQGTEPYYAQLLDIATALGAVKNRTAHQQMEVMHAAALLL